MTLRVLARFRLATWAGLLALTVNAVYPVPLTVNVVAAMVEEAAAGAVHEHHQQPAPATGGHTHRGHADCALCGALGGLACFSLPALHGLVLPAGYLATTQFALLRPAATSEAPAAYRSRAPPQRA